MLLENGADPNVTDKLESTPLHRASAKGNYRLIQLLLKQSASTNIQDSQGNTPLYVDDLYSSEITAKPMAQIIIILSKPDINAKDLGNLI